MAIIASKILIIWLVLVKQNNSLKSGMYLDIVYYFCKGTKKKAVTSFILFYTSGTVV